MRPNNLIFDNVAEPNQLQEGFVKPDWRMPMWLCHSPRQRCPVNIRVYVVCIITVRVQFRESLKRVVFWIAKNLAVHVLLNTSSTDKFIKSIIFSEKEIVTFNSPPVLTVMGHETKIVNTEQRQEDTFANTIDKIVFKKELVPVEWTVTFKLYSNIFVIVSKNTKDTVQQHDFMQFKPNYS